MVHFNAEVEVEDLSLELKRWHMRVETRFGGHIDEEDE